MKIDKLFGIVKILLKLVKILNEHFLGTLRKRKHKLHVWQHNNNNNNMKNNNQNNQNKIMKNNKLYDIQYGGFYWNQISEFQERA